MKVFSYRAGFPADDADGADHKTPSELLLRNETQVGQTKGAKVSAGHRSTRAGPSGLNPLSALIRVIRGKDLGIGLLALLAFAPRLAAQVTSPNDAAMAADPNAAQLERGKRVFRLNECNYCHGIDLTRAPRGARADLKHNPLVGVDEKGELIGVIVMNGLPMSQTSMPRFGDVITPEEMSDLAAYIHFQRQAERYKELVTLKDAPGNSAEGKAYFNDAGKCTACHAPAAIATAAKKLDAPALKLNTLHPPKPSSPNAKFDEGYRAHLRIVERITDQEFLNLLAYLNSLR